MSNNIRVAQSYINEEHKLHYRVHTPTVRLSLHGHNFYELDVILDGESTTVLNGEEFSVKKGDAFFLTPNDFHSFPETGALKFFNVHFKEETVSSGILERLITKESRAFTLSDNAFNTLLQIIKVLDSINDESPLAMQLKSRIMECVLLLLDESITRSMNSTTNDMQKAITYIYAHFKNNPSLSEVSSYLALNEKYFCKKFHEYTGETYKSYLRKMKLHYAKQLVISTDKPLIEIALDSGYETQSHFNREFKQFYGVTPLDMRKSNQKEKTAT